MTEPRRVRVRAGDGSADYDVLVGNGLLGVAGSTIVERLPSVRSWAVIGDSNVFPRYGDRVLGSLAEEGREASPHVFAAGEASKSRATWGALTDSLLASGLGRDGGVIAVGGGVVGDLAGFVAATYQRGVPVVQIPTTVVAMVDSAVGGKTAVDTPAGKNLVGAFHPPSLVLADPTVLETLTPRLRAEGWAEAVKHGAIVDEAYFESLAGDAEALLSGQAEAAADAVLRSVEIKADIVSQDEREAGLREILNFGHTLGHALEASSGYALSHGAAVSIGMVLEARLGESLGVTAAGTAARLESVLDRFGLPTAPAENTDRDAVLELVRRDKKVRGGVPRYALLERIGTVARNGGWARPAEPGAVARILASATS